jgi:hypothetical protein
MIRNGFAAAALIVAGLLIGCGTSSTSPGGGSKGQATTGVSSVSGYPAGQPKDAGSPALASSTEAEYSREQKKEAK